ncbi:PEBP-like protein [Tilletiopsis washingtonensis]|uniref:PEBP-like protein n=1 Tax=Tilletiopsis washingtonensis TaxID=58919 RepID=A0A316Z8Q8_9BASI|nr:PEBP-like protein [Tilletiopsis washingtonensis]PWN97961.1 PEBP-like protein [Tilletiopsis washingtonensis]
MFARSLLVLSLSAGAALAQQASLSQVAEGLASTRAQLNGAGLVPNPISEQLLNLTAVLSLQFGSSGSPVAIGTSQSVSDVTQAPSYRLEFAPESASALSGKTFTVAFLDAGAAGVGNPDGLLTRHFLGNNFNLGSDGILSNSTPAITEYASPAPAPGSGPHRYFQVVFLQGDDFRAPSNLSQPGTPLSTMSLAGYAQEANLRQIVAASYVSIEDNSASVTDSISSTQAPASSSVAALATSISRSLAGGSATSGGSSSSTRSGSSGAPSGTSAAGGSNGAVKLGAGAGLLAVLGAAAVLL